MFLLRFILIFLSLASCKVTSVDEMSGLVNPHFTQVHVTLDSKNHQPDIELLFKPDIFSIGEGAQTSQYTISFSILKAPDQNTFYDHVNAFLSFINEGTLQDPILRYKGLTIKNCSLCSDLFTGFQNEQGEDITDNSSSTAVLTRDALDGFFHLHSFLDPLHEGDTWRIIHGFPGTVAGTPQIIYPYYRVDFSIPKE